MYIYMHVFICGKLFSKTEYSNLALALQDHFFGMVLNAFWKRASSTLFLLAWHFAVTYRVNGAFLIPLLAIYVHACCCFHIFFLFIKQSNKFDPRIQILTQKVSAPTSCTPWGCGNLCHMVAPPSLECIYLPSLL